MGTAGALALKIAPLGLRHRTIKTLDRQAKLR
jgi:hypothetical protein